MHIFMHIVSHLSLSGMLNAATGFLLFLNDLKGQLSHFVINNVVLNLYNFVYFVEHIRRYFDECLTVFVCSMKVSRFHNSIELH